MAFNESPNFDLNDFINEDEFYNPSREPSSPNRMMVRSSIHDGHPSDSQPRLYSAPSHDYGQHRQQTGLPPDAMSSIAANNGFNNPFNTSMVGLDAGQYNSYNNLNMDYQPSPSNIIYSPGNNMQNFIDPSAIDAQMSPEVWSAMPMDQSKDVSSSSKHSQRKQQQQYQPTPMVQVPSTKVVSSSSTSNATNNTSEAQKNEQISRLLKQMRQSSTTSTIEDDNLADNESHTLAKLKKDEDEMDEDERLLASEQGKKLTSKERRQLRNKVSARAFRSRRKEYIGQLEGEVAAKANENTELKQRIRALMEQNQQLTQLTRVFLGHPAFQSFMDDVSRDRAVLDRLIAESSNQSNPESLSQQQQQPRKESRSQSSSSASQADVANTIQPQDQSLHVGMSMLPENNLDFSNLNLGGQRFQPTMAHFNPSNAGYAGAGFQGHQVFALYDVPTGPSMEELRFSRQLSEKSDWSDIVDVLGETDRAVASENTKSMAPEVPELPSLPVKSAPKETTSMDIDSNQQACELFPTLPSSYQIPLLFETKPISSPKGSIQSKTTPSTDDAIMLRRLTRLFASTEAACARVDRMTRYLC